MSRVDSKPLGFLPCPEYMAVMEKLVDAYKSFELKLQSIELMATKAIVKVDEKEEGQNSNKLASAAWQSIVTFISSTKSTAGKVAEQLHDEAILPLQKLSKSANRDTQLKVAQTNLKGSLPQGVADNVQYKKLCLRLQNAEDEVVRLQRAQEDLKINFGENCSEALLHRSADRLKRAIANREAEQTQLNCFLAESKAADETQENNAAAATLNISQTSLESVDHFNEYVIFLISVNCMVRTFYTSQCAMNRSVAAFGISIQKCCPEDYDACKESLEAYLALCSSSSKIYLQSTLQPDEIRLLKGQVQKSKSGSASPIQKSSYAKHSPRASYRDDEQRKERLPSLQIDNLSGGELGEGIKNDENVDGASPSPVNLDGRHKNVIYQSTAYTNTEVTDKIYPDLQKWMTINCDSHVPVFSRWHLVQERYEDFLLTILHQKLYSNAPEQHWDSPNFLNSIKVAEGISEIPFSVPCNTMFTMPDTSIQSPYAFDWASRKISDQDWCCLSYELLLLCYQHHASTLVSQNLLIACSESERASQFPCSVLTSLRYESVRSRAVHSHLGKNFQRFMNRYKVLKVDNLSMLKILINQARLQFGLTSRQSNIIVSLMLPNASRASFGTWDNIHPLDVRYRAVQLLNAWQIADETIEESNTKYAQDETYKSWILRQLHILYISVAFRMQRLIKFFPNVPLEMAKNILTQDWHHFGHFLESDDKALGNKPNLLVNCCRKCQSIICTLQEIVESDKWGNICVEVKGESKDKKIRKILEGKEDAQSNGFSLILQLLHNMTVAEQLDYLIRSATYKMQASLNTRVDGDMDTKSVFRMEEFSNYLLQFDTEDDNLDKDSNYNSGSKKKGGDAKDRRKRLMSKSIEMPKVVPFSIHPTEMLLSAYWAYDLPILLMFLACLYRCCTDPSSEPFLHHDAPICAQALLFVAHTAQVGTDPTVKSTDWSEVCEQGVYGNGLTTITMDTIELLYAQALWFTANQNRKGSFVIEKNLSESTVNAVHSILSGQTSNLYRIAIDTFETGISASDEAAFNEFRFYKLRQKRLGLCTPPDIKTAIEYPFRTTLLSKFLDQSWKNSDWTSSNEVQKLIQASIKSKAIVSARPKLVKHTMSLSTPSRVERGATEVFCRRLITWKFRYSIASVLSNYRRFVEPRSLSNLISSWLIVLDLQCGTSCKIRNDPNALKCIATTVNSKKIAQLSTVLTGPTIKEEILRFFVCETTINFYLLLFEPYLDRLKNPSNYVVKSELDENNKMHSKTSGGFEKEDNFIEKFGNTLKVFAAELLCEIMHYAPIWDQYLPPREHLAICFHAAQQQVHKACQQILHPDIWEPNTLPRGGEVVLEGLDNFRSLFSKVADLLSRQGIRLHTLATMELFHSAVTHGLQKKLEATDEILDRCITNETWEPVNPPSCLYTALSVDVLTFINYATEASVNMRSPIAWLCSSLQNFIIKFYERYSKSVIIALSSVPINTIREVCVENFNALLVTQKRSASAAAKIFYRKKTVKQFDKHQVSSKYLTRIKELIDKQPSGPESDQIRETQSDTSDGSDGELNADESDDNDISPNKGAETKKKTVRGNAAKLKKLFHTKTAKTGVSSAHNENDARLSHELSALLDLIRDTAEDTIMKSLVQLHCLAYHIEQLPCLSEKFASLLKTRIHRHENLDSIFNQYANTKEKPSTLGEHSKQERAEAGNLQEFYDDVLSSCQRILNSTVADSCKFIANDMVFHEMAQDLFEELYNPDFSSSSISGIVNQFPNTIEKFLKQTPDLFQDEMASEFIVCFLQAWCLLIVEICAQKETLNEEEINFLEVDLDYIRGYIEDNQIDDTIVDEEDITVSACNHTNDFLVLLATDPDVFVGGVRTTQSAQQEVSNVTKPSGLSRPVAAAAAQGKDAIVYARRKGASKLKALRKNVSKWGKWRTGKRKNESEDIGEDVDSGPDLGIADLHDEENNEDVVMPID